MSLGVKSNHYGAMLIPIIVEKLTNDIRLEISRKLGKSCWEINQCNVLSNEIVPR